MKKGERENVYKVYDKIAVWFSQNRNKVLLGKNYLDDLVSNLPAEATILDLGCGTGDPILKYLLSKKFNVTGVDASTKYLKSQKQTSR